MPEQPASPWPRYYAVNDRPVKFEETPDGGLAILALDFVTGGWEMDVSYLSRVSDVGVGKDVDQLSPEAFGRLCAAQLASTATPRIEVLREARALVAASTDFDDSWWDDAEGCIAELDAVMHSLHAGRASGGSLFLPTSGLQELSLSSGWGDAFVDLGNRWDAASS